MGFVFHPWFCFADTRQGSTAYSRASSPAPMVLGACASTDASFWGRAAWSAARTEKVVSTIHFASHPQEDCDLDLCGSATSKAKLHTQDDEGAQQWDGIVCVWENWSASNTNVSCKMTNANGFELLFLPIKSTGWGDKSWVHATYKRPAYGQIEQHLWSDSKPKCLVKIVTGGKARSINYVQPTGECQVRPSQ